MATEWTDEDQRQLDLLKIKKQDALAAFRKPVEDAVDSFYTYHMSRDDVVVELINNAALIVSVLIPHAEGKAPKS